MIGKKSLHAIITLLTIALVLLCRVSKTRAQSISVRALVDKTSLSLDDHLALSVIIEGANISSLSDPELPDLPDFSIVNSYQGSNFSWINGKVSISKTIKYILSPLKPGVFTIPPIKIKEGRETHQTESITINVSQSTSPNQSPYSPPTGQPYPPFPSPQAPQDQTTGGYTKNKGNIFITNTVNKTKVYVNEQIILTFGFYRRIELSRNPSYSQSPLEGFWVEDLEGAAAPKIQIVEGRQYQVQEIKKALFPLSPGQYTIGPATLSYQTGFFATPRILKTESITIEVLPLPEEGKPKNFKGAVGDFTISSLIDNQKCVQNEPIILHVKVKGVGHIENIQEPDLEEVPDFQKYDTTITQNIMKQERIEGEKNFDILLIPRKAGDLKIPLVNFSFFNPNDQKYHTINTKPIIVSIAPAQSTTTASSSPDLIAGGSGHIVTKQNVTQVQEDIRYIKIDPKSLRKYNFLFEDKLYWCILCIPIIALFSCWVIDNKRQRLQCDISYARLRRAYRLSKKNLKNARLYNKRGNDKDFYAVISKLLTEYVADKLNVQAAGLTSQQITEQLQTIGISEKITTQLHACLDECDFARFAPGSGESKARDNILAKAEELIQDLEKNIKEKR